MGSLCSTFANFAMSLSPKQNVLIKKSINSNFLFCSFTKCTSQILERAGSCKLANYDLFAKTSTKWIVTALLTGCDDKLIYLIFFNATLHNNNSGGSDVYGFALAIRNQWRSGFEPCFAKNFSFVASECWVMSGEVGMDVCLWRCVRVFY